MKVFFQYLEKNGLSWILIKKKKKQNIFFNGTWNISLVIFFPLYRHFFFVFLEEIYLYLLLFLFFIQYHIYSIFPMYKMYKIYIIEY